MAEQRHRTVLEYRVDDRQIKGLDQTLHRAFDDKLFEAFEKTLERSAKHLESLTKVAERFESVMRRNGGSMGAGGGSGGGGSRAPAPAPPSAGGDLGAAINSLARSINQLQQAERSRASRMPGAGTMAAASYMGSYMGGLASRAGGGGDGFIGQAVGGIPLIGGFLSGAVGAVQRYYAEHAAQQVAISQQVGRLGSTRLRGARSYTGFGLNRGAAFAQAAQFAQSGGLTGDELTGGIARNALGLQMLGGINDPTAIIGAQGIGGGMAGRNGAQLMLQAVSAGIVSGVREARLGQFVAAATQVLEQGRLEGADLSADSINQLVQGFSAMGMGFLGERGQRAMSSAVPTMRQFSPGMDVASLVGMRAAGFGPGTSLRSVRRQFQTNPEQLMPRIIETIRGMAPGNEDAQAELMRMILPRFAGFTPSEQQLDDLIAGDTSGFTSAVSAQAGQQFMQRRAAGLGGAFATPATEASYQDARATVGGQVGGAAIRLRNIELAMTQTILPRVAQGIESILSWLQESYGAYQRGGIGEMLQQALGPIIGALGQTLYAQLANVPGLSPEMRQRAEESAQAARDLLENPQRVLGEIGEYIQGRIRSVEESVRGGPIQPVPAGLLHPGTGATTPQPAGDLGPSSSAVDALRRIQRDAGIAADAIEVMGLPAEGALAMG